MSENQSFSNSSSTQPVNQLGSIDGVSQLMNDGVAQQARPLEVEPVDLWEAVAPVSTGESSTGGPSTGGPSIEEALNSTFQDESISCETSHETSRETELLALIHDLNECNDVLLTRVAQLEDNLEQTQVASKADIEKAQATAKNIQERLSRQVSAEHASVQQVSQNAQQQVAKVVTQLETTEQALSRQQLISENLQTALNNSLERVSQLERDCALSAQKHAEEAKARVKAETTSRDLKTRLQRQQRYTLQFKAALEKSLTVSSRTESRFIKTEAARPVPFKETASVVMPKAQRIMPWASVTSSPSFQGIDPHLETLIRSVGKPDAAEVIFPEVSPGAEAPKVAVNESEAVNEPAVTEDAVAVERTVDGAIAANAKTPEPEKTGDPATEAPFTETATRSQTELQITPTDITPTDIEKSFAAATRQRLETDVAFTEPSPWGKPLPQKVEAVPTATTQIAMPQSLDSHDYLPAIDSTTDSTVAPVAQPLRPQKKIGSLASVELPTFPNAKVSSFKR